MGRIDRPSGYAHVLVDEAQDLSPMQWRMLARRGRAASWTVVSDAAQASWSDLVEAGRARDEAFSGQERRAFHMDTNYRNAREIFDYARDFILPLVPDADIPDAVRETGVDPVDRVVAGSLAAAAADAVDQLLGEVEGSIAVIAGRRWAERLAGLDGRATVGCRSSTRCRPRAWSGTRPSSSTPRASSRSHRAGCGCCTSC